MPAVARCTARRTVEVPANIGGDNVTSVRLEPRGINKGGKIFLGYPAVVHTAQAR
jgi:hypothetical protein